MTPDETTIPLSRTKMVFLIAVSVGFVALGAWLLTLPDAQILPRHAPLFVHGIVIAGIVLFGLCGILGVRRLFAHGVGLQLSSAGIRYASGPVAMGFAPWSDIAGFDIMQVKSTRFLVVKLHDPQKYIAQGSRARQMLNQANMNMCGSPITISSNTLAIGFATLVALFEHYWSQYGRAA